MRRLRSAFVHTGKSRATCESISDTMRSVLQIGYGAVDKSIGFGRVATPAVSSHDVLVKVKAASVNQIDAKLRWGYGKSVLELPPENQVTGSQKAPPFILGRDFSGEIVQIGNAVPEELHFELGKEVFGFVGQLSAQGSWSEYVKVPYWSVAAKPDYLTHVEAASLPFVLSGVTELAESYIRVKLRSTNRITILGGGTGGSVSYFLAMLFKSKGIEPTVYHYSKGAESLKEINIEKHIPYAPIPFAQKSVLSSAVFLPNGIDKMEQLNQAWNILRPLLSPNAIGKDNLQIFRLFPFGLEANEKVDKEGVTPPTGIPKTYWLASQRASLIRPEMFTRYNEIETPELSLYPNITYQRGYHIGLRNLTDALQYYIMEKTKKENLCCIGKVFPFSKAKEAHQLMDDGEYKGKIVLSMEELWNNEDQSVEYKDYDELNNFTVPSSSLFSTLLTSR